MNAPVVPPANYAAYQQKLRGSLPEKLDLLLKVPKEATAFVDFGCGGMALMNAFWAKRIDLSTDNICLYDSDPEMLKSPMYRPATRTTELDAVWRWIKRKQSEGRKVCLVLSSVIHEATSLEDWPKFWHMLQDLAPDFIAIRDMALSVRDLKWQKEIESAFKLEYKDHPDFQKECNENYFPLTVEQFQNWTTICSGYGLEFYEHKPLDYMVNKWKDHLPYMEHVPTHMKLILRRTR